MSLRNTTTGVGASRRSGQVSSGFLSVPLIKRCLLRFVRSQNGEHPGVVPGVQSMSVHLVLVRSSLGVVRCSVVFVDGLQKILVRAFARLRVGPTRFSIQDR